MSKQDDYTELDELLERRREHRAPENFCARVLAEAGRTRQEEPPVLERWKAWLQEGRRWPVLTLVPATAAILLLAVVLTRAPDNPPLAPANQFAGSEGGIPQHITANEPGSSSPVADHGLTQAEAAPRIADLSESEFEVVLVLDTLMETEETEIWAEDSEMYF